MSKLIPLPLAVLAVLLAGCATQVPQSLPPQMVPAVFTGPTATAAAWPDAVWWQSFGDPDLSALIVKAEAGNRNLAAAAARVTQAQAQSRIQGAALFPQISGQASQSGGGCQGQGCQDFASKGTSSLSFNASYELDFWGLAHDNLRAAEEQVKSARFAQQSVALTVAANVADQYLNVLAIRRRIGVVNEEIAAIQAILQIIELKVTTGASSHLDLAREQAQEESVEASLPGLETAEKQALFTLAVLLGQKPEGFDVKAQNLDAILAPAIGAGLPSELLQRRPDIAQAEANLASAHANLDAARAAFLPQISLTGAGGFASTAIGTLLQGSSFGYGYGASLLQAIFDGGKLAGQKHLAEGVQQELIADYQNAVLNAYGDVETALVEVANTGTAQQHLTLEINAAREAFQISELQFRQGAADFLTVLQAQQTLFSAEDQLAQMALANRQSAVHLFEALGGGWTEKPEDRTQRAPTDASATLASGG